MNILITPLRMRLKNSPRVKNIGSCLPLSLSIFLSNNFLKKMIEISDLKWKDALKKF